MGNDQPKFNANKLKTNLSMAVTRLNLIKNKKHNLNYQLREEIANYLRNGQEELALIKIEGFINNENFISAMELVSTFCVLCKERHRQLTESQECPADLRTAIETLIFSAPRTDCQELIEVRNQFAGKFGVEFCKNANENRDGMVNSIVAAKLEARVPDEEIKILKLKELAVQKGIDYHPKYDVSEMQNFNVGQAPQHGNFRQPEPYHPPMQQPESFNPPEPQVPYYPSVRFQGPLNPSEPFNSPEPFNPPRPQDPYNTLGGPDEPPYRDVDPPNSFDPSQEPFQDPGTIPKYPEYIPPNRPGEHDDMKQTGKLKPSSDSSPFILPHPPMNPKVSESPDDLNFPSPPTREEKSDFDDISALEERFKNLK